MSSIKILVVDDHPVVRTGLSAMFAEEDDMEVVGEAANGVEALEKARALQPDIILMDLRMPELDGVQAMQQLAAENNRAKFIVLTTYDTDEHIVRGIEAGARAFFLKDTPSEDLLKGIRAVYRGESFMQPAVTTKVLDRFIELSRHVREPDTLTEREIDVLTLIAKGQPNKTIANELFISESTVKARIATIFQKMGVSDRTEAVAQALQKGLLHL